MCLDWLGLVRLGCLKSNIIKEERRARRTKSRKRKKEKERRGVRGAQKKKEGENERKEAGGVLSSARSSSPAGVLSL